MRKIGLLLIAVTIALGCCGVGFAAWSQTLEAGGTVEVEDCWVEYCRAESNDPGETIDPDKPQHVASTEVEIKRGYKHCQCWCFSRYNKLIVTVDNAYPCYQPTVDFWVKAHSRWHSAHLDCLKINDTEVTPGDPVDLGDIVVTVDPPETIDPCHCEKGNIILHVEQSAMKCHTYEFTVTMCYNFW